MENIFETSAGVSTPLALAGVFASILFFILKQILASRKKSGKLSEQSTMGIVNRLFILALISMFLGFAGWVSADTISDTKKISFITYNYKNRRPIEGLQFRAPELGIAYPTNRDGMIEFEVYKWKFRLS